MILTDRFVYIHMPKTGGTFVTRAVKQVYRGRDGVPLDVDKHGTCNDIPATHRHLPVVSTLRNPYDRYVSQFEYGGWRKHPRPGITIAEMTALYPHFPDLTFAEYVEMASTRFHHVKTPHLAAPDRPGYLSEQFVRFYFREPGRVLHGFGRRYLDSGAYRSDMHDVGFLRTERLTEDLCEFLASVGFGADDCAAVRRLGRVSPPRVWVGPVDLLLRRRPRRTERDWRTYYTPELAATVRRREWFLFKLFPEYDVPL